MSLLHSLSLDDTRMLRMDGHGSVALILLCPASVGRDYKLMGSARLSICLSRAYTTLFTTNDSRIKQKH